MTWIKVCGLQEPDHVDLVQACGADAIGLNLAKGSPRRISVDTATALARRCEIECYLVLVDATPESALEAARRTGATGIQPHGTESAEVADAAAGAGLAVLRPVPVTGPVDLSAIPDGQVPLLDTARPGMHGGTGERWDPGLLGVVDRRWVLAGGLTPGNVREAVATMHPWGVDASSGLESTPGRKDPGRIRSFIEEARAT